MRYTIRIQYQNGQSRSSKKPVECRISAREAGAMMYGFDGRDLGRTPWEVLNFDSPLLEVEESRDDSGQLAFVKVTVKKWEGFQIGTIFINKYIAFPIDAFRAKGRMQNLVGLSKKVPVEMFEKQQPLSARAL